MHGFCYEFHATLSATEHYCITPDQMLSIRSKENSHFSIAVLCRSRSGRISMLMSIQIQIPGLATKQCRSPCGSYPKFYSCWKSYYFTFSHSIDTLQCFFFLISARCVIWFQYFGHFLTTRLQLEHRLGFAWFPFEPKQTFSAKPSHPFYMA